MMSAIHFLHVGGSQLVEAPHTYLKSSIKSEKPKLLVLNEQYFKDMLYLWNSSPPVVMMKSTLHKYMQILPNLGLHLMRNLHDF